VEGGAPEMAFDGILWGLGRYQVLECGYGDLGAVVRPCQVMAGEAVGKQPAPPAITA
jgi:hypothetical protein